MIQNIILFISITILILLVGIFITLHKKDGRELEKKDNIELENFFRNEINSTKTHVTDSLDKTKTAVNTQLEKIIKQASKLEGTTESLQFLQQDIVNLNKTLGDKKTRGIFGETILKQVLSIVYGENDKLFKLEHTISPGKRVDAIVYAPNNLMIPIDSKFPLENFINATKDDNTPETTQNYEKQFKKDITKRVEETSKYIVDGITTPYAIMFIPAEGVYNEIYSKHYAQIENAQKKKVLIVSPTTLMPILYNILFTLSLIKQNKEAKEIHRSLLGLGEEFKRFTDRWEKLDKKIDEISVKKDEMNITTKKIVNKFNTISKG